MKKLFILLLALIVPLTFFSVLASTTGVAKSDITLFFDVQMQEKDRLIISRRLSDVLDEQGYRASVEPFERLRLNSYILSNPDALFISQQEVSSDLFALERLEYFDVVVPVSPRNSILDNLDSTALMNSLLIERTDDRETLKRVMRNRIDLGIISMENLSLHVKPLSVDGVLPTLEAVRDGSYPWKYAANVYGRGDNALISGASLRENISLDLDRIFTFIAGGDIMLSRGTGRHIDLHGPRYPFEKIRDIIQEHDIAFANLESPISSRGKRFIPNKGIYFRANPSVVEGLVFAGFDVFSLGNNHSLDWGATALQDTISILKQHGFSHSGAGITWQEALRPAVLDVRGTKVAIISINDIYPFKVTEGGEQTMQTLTYDPPALQREIRTMDKKYDIIITSVHAGIEYIQEPEPVKVNMMQNLVDYGVDVVIGHHPHVIQGIEVYGEGLIAYSLGNLIFDQEWSRETSLGLLLEICFFEDRPLYYTPRVVFIEDSQARMLDHAESQSIVKTLSVENTAYEYVKN